MQAVRLLVIAVIVVAGLLAGPSSAPAGQAISPEQADELLRDKVINLLQGKIAALQTENAQLKEKVAQLEQALQRLQAEAAKPAEPDSRPADLATATSGGAEVLNIEIDKLVSAPPAPSAPPGATPTASLQGTPVPEEYRGHLVSWRGRVLEHTSAKPMIVKVRIKDDGVRHYQVEVELAHRLARLLPIGTAVQVRGKLPEGVLVGRDFSRGAVSNEVYYVTLTEGNVEPSRPAKPAEKPPE